LRRKCGKLAGGAFGLSSLGALGSLKTLRTSSVPAGKRRRSFTVTSVARTAKNWVPVKNCPPSSNRRKALGLGGGTPGSPLTRVPKDEFEGAFISTFKRKPSSPSTETS